MAFNMMFSAIFEQVARKIVEELKPEKNGKPVTVADIKSICDATLASSLIEVRFDSGESKVVHKPDLEYHTCPFVLVRGDREGEVCGKKTRSGCEHCSVHESVIKKSKIEKATCQYILAKGKNPGKPCGATAMKEKTVCSKHATAKINTRKEKIPKPKATLPQTVEDISDDENKHIEDRKEDDDITEEDE